MARCGQVIGEAVEDDVAAREARRVQGARCAPPIFRLTFDRIGEQAPQQPRARGVEAAKRRLLVAQARQFIAAQLGKLGKFILATKFKRGFFVTTNIRWRCFQFFPCPFLSFGILLISTNKLSSKE